MSEELIQKNLTETGEKFDKYEFYNIGNTNINALKQYNIIPNKDYKNYYLLKPDALLVNRENKNNIQAITVFEYKRPDEFDTYKKQLYASKQCNTYCELFDAKFGVITDGNDYIYINPSVDNENADVIYDDSEVFSNQKGERCFSYIKREDGYNLSNPYILDQNDENGTKNFLKLINKITSVINKDNSQFHEKEYKNPSQLAKAVWQNVWLTNQAEPKEALSSFIELFVFKYLSDLSILNENDKGVKISFEYVFNEVDKSKCLTYYSSNVRNYIKLLFPKNPKDKTTLLNGLSLNPESTPDNEIFHDLLSKFNEFGSLRNIDPEFKSRLFEDFLKKDNSKKSLGQFFTPRNVVKSIIEMSDIDKLPNGSKVCDPACGVGGFILENNLTKRPNDYYFEKDKLKCKLDYYGYEKSSGNNDLSIVVLAKANFIIFLSNLLESHPTLTTEFSKEFNKTFQTYENNLLGSLSEIKENYYDLIMSNPPYVSEGTKIIKETINKDKNLKKYYTNQGSGIEGLFLEKMIRELKINGKAFIVIPEGILFRQNDIKLRKFILEKCILDAIISLPTRTFYSTYKKTYIIALTKKEDSNIQKEPVFTYLIKNIGETLDNHRVPIDENDLKEMATNFKYFMVNKKDYGNINNDTLCKIIDFDFFKDNVENDWLIDKFWQEDEEIEFDSIDDLINFYQDEKDTINEEIDNSIEEIKKILYSR